MQYAKALLEIVKNTKGGVIIYTNNVTDIIKEIYELTGEQLKPQRQQDSYLALKMNWKTKKYVTEEKTRNNNRKHRLIV